MTDLSPAAQAVLTAATQKLYCLDPEDVPMSASEYGSVIAAALRAVADEVAPETPESEPDDPDMLKGIWSERRTIRDELLAIAEELEAQ
jgi:hypothetical protein